MRQFYDDEITGKAYDSRLMKRLMGYARPYVFYIVMAVLLIICTSALDLIWPQFWRIAIDDYVAGETLTVKEKFGALKVIGGLYFISLILYVIMHFAHLRLATYIGQNVLHDIRMELFSHVEELSMNFFTKNPVGRLVTRMTNDVERLSQLFTTGMVGIFGDVIILFGILVVMLWMDVKLAIIACTVLPLIILSVVVFRKFVRPAYLEVRKNLARINAYLQEHISGIKVVQAFNHEERSEEKFDKLNSDHLNSRLKVVKIHALFVPSIDAFSHLAISVLLFFGAVEIYRGSMELGMLIAFVMYSRRFYRPIRDLSQKYNILQDAMSSSERIFKLIDTEDNIEDREDPVRLTGKVEGHVEFKDVWFSYNPGEWVLKGVDLKVSPGEKIALVGVTGSGKTTIVNLLARFYEYQKGSITLDGRELKNLAKKDLREQLAYVHQDFFLFAGTLMDNIRLWNKDITDEEAVKAAEIVNVDKFAEKLPRRYREPVLEGGSNLSTGQKQLISFARALAFKPSILILDEATSNIDSETEKLIQEALEKLLEKQTSIIIAHRLSTIKHVDRILVVHKGEIVEEGNHEELLEKGGIYSNLYKLQYRDIDEESAM